MAQSVVGSLFGPTPEELQRQRVEQQAILSQNANRVSPSYGLGYNVGTLIGQGLGALFGNQDPALAKAAGIRKVLQETQSSLGENAANPAMLYGALQKNLAEAGFGEEAFMAAGKAQEYDQTARMYASPLARLQRDRRAADKAGLPEEVAQIDAQIAKLTSDSKPDEIGDTLKLLDEAKTRGDDRAVEAYEGKLNQLTGGNKKLSPAQVAIDKDTGKEISQWVNLGGRSVVDTQLKKIDSVIDMLEKGKRISGPEIAAANAFGDAALSTISPEALQARDVIGGVIQSDLRAVLGGQFAQKEGEQLLARGFNIAAEPSYNLERLIDLRNQIANRASAKEASVKYFQEKGTMAGYTGPTYDIGTKVDESASPSKADIFKEFQRRFADEVVQEGI